MFGLRTSDGENQTHGINIAIKQEADEDVNDKNAAIAGLAACDNDGFYNHSPKSYTTSIPIKMEPDTADHNYAHMTAMGMPDSPSGDYDQQSPETSEPENSPKQQSDGDDKSHGRVTAMGVEDDPGKTFPKLPEPESSPSQTPQEDFSDDDIEDDDDDDEDADDADDGDDDVNHPNAKVCVFCSNTYADLNALNLHIHVTHLAEEEQRVNDPKGKPCTSKAVERNTTHPLCHCFACSIDFSSPLLLRVHYTEMHEDIKTGPCPYCGQVFRKSEIRTQHIHSMHPVSEAGITDLSCPVCQQKSTTVPQLIKHVGTAHRVARTSFCPICAKGFTSPAVLKNHIANVHNRQKSSTCTICGKVLANQYSLEQHIKFVHQSIKTYVCPYCQKSFGAPQALRTHVSSTHEGALCGPCRYCGQCFRHRKSLLLHIGAVHENSKTDPCEVCGRIFVMNFQLKAHMRKFHPELVYGSHRPPPKSTVWRK